MKIFTRKLSRPFFQAGVSLAALMAIAAPAAHSQAAQSSNTHVRSSNAQSQSYAQMPASNAPARSFSARTPGANTQSPTSNAQSRSSTSQLHATIQHSDSLPPLPAKYRAGAFYGAYGLPSPTGASEPRTNVQFQIPDWLAGKWERSHSIETQRTELPSNKPLKPAGMTTAKSQDVFGTYRDKQGRIWQIFSSDHATGEVDRGELVDRHTVTKYNLDVINSKTAVVEVRAFHLVVNKKTQRIVQSYQDEEFNTYTYVGEGIAKTDSSVKVFDGDGNPQLLTRSHSDVIRKSRFEDLNASR